MDTPLRARELTAKLNGAPDFPDPSSSGGFVMKPPDSSSFNVPQANAA